MCGAAGKRIVEPCEITITIIIIPTASHRATILGSGREGPWNASWAAAVKRPGRTVSPDQPQAGCDFSGRKGSVAIITGFG